MTHVVVKAQKVFKRGGVPINSIISSGGHGKALKIDQGDVWAIDFQKSGGYRLFYYYEFLLGPPFFFANRKGIF